MDTLETLVRDSLATQGDRAPGADFLLRAVRVGVTRRRRERLAVSLGAALGAVGLVTGLLLAFGPGATAPRTRDLLRFSGHLPPVATAGPGQPVPAAVTAAADQLSHAFVAHPPARMVWVATSLNAWYGLERQSPVADDQRAYVVELRNAAPVACAMCKGLVTPVGRFGILVVPLQAGADGGEFVITDTDYPLADLGTVQTLDGEF
jgi:hypothetical protein